MSNNWAQAPGRCRLPPESRKGAVGTTGGSTRSQTAHAICYALCGMLEDVGMTLPASRNQIDALGDRLRKGDPRPGDQDMLDAWLRKHDAALASVVEELRTIDLGDGTLAVPTSRVKTRGTLVEKLVREKTRLSAVQDIAGTRIVVGPTLDQEDRIAEIVMLRFADSKMIDPSCRPEERLPGGPRRRAK